LSHFEHRRAGILSEGYFESKFGRLFEGSAFNEKKNLGQNLFFAKVSSSETGLQRISCYKKEASLFCWSPKAVAGFNNV
jgi:hypothetical protein